MGPNQAVHRGDQSATPRVSVIGVLFFLLGTPHIYESLRRQSLVVRQKIAIPYGRMVLLAAILAALLELSALV